MDPDQNAPPPPAEGAAPPAPPGPTVDQQMAAMLTRMDQQQQLIEGMAMKAFAPPAPQHQTPTDDGTFVDPDVKAIRAQQAAQAREMASLREGQDAQYLNARAQELGVGEAELKEAIALHQNWVRNGMTFGGQPPSRVDALHYSLGLSYGKQKQTAAQEAARLRQNQHAFTENGGRQVMDPSPLPPNFAELPETQQANLLATKLDKSGGW